MTKISEYNPVAIPTISNDQIKNAKMLVKHKSVLVVNQ